MNQAGSQAHQFLTPRLTLRLMLPAFLEACLAEDQAQAEALLGLKIPPVWFQEKELIDLRLNDCRHDPAYEPWTLRAIGLRSEGLMIGHIGFHTKPNPEYLREFVPDGIELGYMIFPEYRRQGYAEEAVRGLIGWAAAQGVRRFIASVSPSNVASLALVNKLGFLKIGEHLDEVDGMEGVYVLAGELLARLSALDV